MNAADSMLDLPVASRDRTLDGLSLPKRDDMFPSAAWQARHVTAPVWRLDKRARVRKRAIDVSLAAVMLILLTIPVMAIMLAIRLESPGPILFRQRRVGLHGKEFTMLKFRTMYRHAPAMGMLRQATRHDPRVTPTGRWLRRYSLDELPQIINVLRGEMSLVGPRPHAPGTRAGERLFEEVTNRYATRHCVKPGMTGLAQVRGWRGETETEEKLLRRIECDLEYIATWSVRLDLTIVWRTIGSVLHMRNAY